jgi:hypothetical protein
VVAVVNLRIVNDDMQPSDELSSVVFIFDYVQLVFQDCRFTIYNRLRYHDADVAIAQGEPGFCDALVGLIGGTATVEFDENRLNFQFASGATLTVSKDEADASGPEAWGFLRLGGTMYVEQN